MTCWLRYRPVEAGYASIPIGTRVSQVVTPTGSAYSECRTARVFRRKGLPGCSARTCPLRLEVTANGALLLGTPCHLAGHRSPEARSHRPPAARAT